MKLTVIDYIALEKIRKLKPEYQGEGFTIIDYVITDLISNYQVLKGWYKLDIIELSRKTGLDPLSIIEAIDYGEKLGLLEFRKTRKRSRMVRATSKWFDILFKQD